MESENSRPLDARSLFQAAAQNLSLLPRLPVSTYRLQFNCQFTFSQAREIVPYLHNLGITDCYSSPYFLARPKSLHGYDVLNPNQLNPEIGTEDEYRAFTAELEKYGMGQILDIVPNHMSISGNENLWWLDVLENGPSSPYASFFDIGPVKKEQQDKVLLPILGDQFGRVLESRDLRLAWEHGAFVVYYFEQRLPLDPVSYNRILKCRPDVLENSIGKDHPDFQELLSIQTALQHLPPYTERNEEKILERQREKEIVKRRLWNLYENSPEIRSFIDENVRLFNGEKGNPRSFDALDSLLSDQPYRLSHWRVATEEINYRRFFNINELAAIRMEDPRVFHETHRLIFRLVREKKVTGLRVDHPDGLYNPVEYFYRLQKCCFAQFCLHFLDKETKNAQEKKDAEEPDRALHEELENLYDQELARNPGSPLRAPFFIVGEKILIKNERIPETWPIFGTIGYVFLNLANGVLIDAENGKLFDAIYTRFIGGTVNFQQLVYEKKKLIMLTAMAGEINILGHYLNRLSEKDRNTRDFTLNSLTTAILEVISCFPVYRTYINDWGVPERDRKYIEQAVSRAKRKNPALSSTIFDFLENILLLRYPKFFRETDKTEWLDFVMKFQQLTGPVMAKGMEDTVFYIYNRLISLNEVGGYPEKFGHSLEVFHGQNLERRKSWPHSLNASSTHDTKRSEDVRARINVLSEIPLEWKKNILRWTRMNRKKKTATEGQWLPDRNDEYHLYQTLIGTWPLHKGPGAVPDESFTKRIKDYMLKALREAKINTSWINPNTRYEEAMLAFIDGLLSNSDFIEDFGALAEKVSFWGMFNSLSQTLLKITAPGIPDFYQGTEIWNFSLVDPDNRGPVDYGRCREMLRNLCARMEENGPALAGLARELVREWRDGAVKLYLTFRALHYRRENAALFQEGEYLSLETAGARPDQICAFARRKGEACAVIVVPRFMTRCLPEGEGSADSPDIWRNIWQDTWIVLPAKNGGKEFGNLFTGETVTVKEHEGKKALPAGEIFASFPAALLDPGKRF